MIEWTDKQMEESTFCVCRTHQRTRQTMAGNSSYALSEQHWKFIGVLTADTWAFSLTQHINIADHKPNHKFTKPACCDSQLVMLA